VFTRVAVPEMRRFGYRTRFTVGVVAGSSVLGMLIPPSAMLIIYAIVTEQSVGHMFIAGIIPGILLSIAYGILILFLAYTFPVFVGGQQAGDVAAEDWANLTWWDLVYKILPVCILVIVVLGGIYGGVFTPTEAGAAGSLAALVIAVLRRGFSWRDLWEVLVETGYITATILFLIITASMYSRMLGVAALPTVFGEWISGFELELNELMFVYVVLMVLLGTIIETASIILIVVPLFLVVLDGYGVNLVWFGIITVVGAEIGLLTPPLGISCFVIKSTIDDPTVSLADIFFGVPVRGNDAACPDSSDNVSASQLGAALASCFGKFTAVAGEAVDVDYLGSAHVVERGKAALGLHRDGRAVRTARHGGKVRFYRRIPGDEPEPGCADHRRR